MRRQRIVILNGGQLLDHLDLWPNDELWSGSGWGYLGRVNSEGVLVLNVKALH